MALRIAAGHLRRNSSTVVSISRRPAAMTTRTFFLDEFAERQWEADYRGTRMRCDKGDLVAAVEDAFTQRGADCLVDGYAPFCKHVFISNMSDATVGAVEISEHNRHLLRSEYQARTEKELPVLVRWFDKADVTPGKAKILDIILYSREQIIQERTATGKPTAGMETLPPWGIISIKAQDEDFELPMTPITIMRNALGKEEGGSGVVLDRAKYMESVAYWQDHAIVT